MRCTAFALDALQRMGLSAEALTLQLTRFAVAAELNLGDHSETVHEFALSASAPDVVPPYTCGGLCHTPAAAALPV